MTNTLEIAPGSVVTLHFSLTLTNGTEAISTFAAEPLSFRMGDQTFQPGMEMALYGLREGDEQTITLTPEQAYGEPDPDLIQQMPLSNFSDKLQPKTEQIISFTLPSGEETMGMLRAIENDQVTIDFNHPLAGHEVVFKVKILAVGIAGTEEEGT